MKYSSVPFSKDSFDAVQIDAPKCLHHKTTYSDKSQQQGYSEISMDKAPLEIELEEGKSTNANCGIFCKQDLQSSFFSLQEPNQQIIDIKATFAPQPYAITIFIRAVFLIFTLVAFILDIITWTGTFHWIAYLTNWGCVYTLLYQIPILVCSIQPNLLSQPLPPVESIESNPPSVLVRFLWSIYTVATTTEMAVMILFWVVLYVPGDRVGFLQVALHGVTAACLLVDGIFVSIIPLRWKHFLFVELVSILFVIWSVIHSFLKNGGPIYPVLDWKNDPVVAIIYVVIVIFVLLPLCYLLIWGLSIVSYKLKCDGSRRKTVNIADEIDF